MAVVTEVGDEGVACDVGTVVVAATAGDTHVLFLKWVGCVVGAAAEAFPEPPACDGMHIVQPCVPTAARWVHFLIVSGHNPTGMPHRARTPGYRL